METGYIYGLFASDRPLYLWECRYIGKTIQSPRPRVLSHIREERQRLEQQITA